MVFNKPYIKRINLFSSRIKLLFRRINSTLCSPAGKSNKALLKRSSSTTSIWNSQFNRLNRIGRILVSATSGNGGNHGASSKHQLETSYQYFQFSYYIGFQLGLVVGYASAVFEGPDNLDEWHVLAVQGRVDLRAYTDAFDIIAEPLPLERRMMFDILHPFYIPVGLDVLSYKEMCDKDVFVNAGVHIGMYVGFPSGYATYVANNEPLLLDEWVQAVRNKRIDSTNYYREYNRWFGDRLLNVPYPLKAKDILKGDYNIDDIPPYPTD